MKRGKKENGLSDKHEDESDTGGSDEDSDSDEEKDSHNGAEGDQEPQEEDESEAHASSKEDEKDKSSVEKDDEEKDYLDIGGEDREAIPDLKSKFSHPVHCPYFPEVSCAERTVHYYKNRPIIFFNFLQKVSRPCRNSVFAKKSFFE